MSTAALCPAACLHCGEPVSGKTSFCCAGCESVYTLLASRGLQYFYSLRGSTRPVPVVVETGPGEPLDLPALELRFYLEGIHCLGCLWLLEKLPEIDGRILAASLDFGHGILRVTRSDTISWREVQALIRHLGYSPRPLTQDDGQASQRQDRIRQAIRLGVAAFCAGNIMLLSVSIYAGAEGALARHFQLLSFLLAIPALTYSAWPLYRSAILPLRAGRLSVDLAVTMAVWVGAGLSVFNLFAGGQAETYFDSLTMLVFLLLASRYCLNRFRESLAKEAPYLSLLRLARYERIGRGQGSVTAEDLEEGDLVLLRASQTLPADATLRAPHAHFDCALLSGESAPQKLLQGDAIDAGAVLLSEEALVKVSRPARTSRLAKITEQISAHRQERSPSLDYADRTGRRFVIVVLTLACLLALSLPYPDGLHRALVLVIVTCPCVLAFAVPLAFTRSLQQAARAGVLFRSAEKIEELARAKTLFLDKTGTLTEGNFEVLDWRTLEAPEKETQAAVLALESRSSHPVAKCLSRHLTPLTSHLPPVEDFREIAGQGVSGKINGEVWKVVRLPNSGSENNVVYVSRNGLPAARISMGDRLRPEAAAFVAATKALGLDPVILSGDDKSRVATAARETGITRWLAELSPEGKAAVVKETPRSLMIGDGANDSIAFQAARAGIAMQGAMALSLESADVVLARPGLAGALSAVRAARRSMTLVRSCFAVSLAYNVVAGALAVSGRMSPLLAAAIMPLSALSVFALIQWNTRKEWR